MNSLNYIGVYVFPTMMIFFTDLLGESIIDGYEPTILARTSMSSYYFFFGVLFVTTIVDIVFFMNRKFYMFFYYPYSFFDRNWYVFLFGIYLICMFYAFLNPILFLSLFLLVLVINNFINLKRFEKYEKIAEETKKLLEHPDYDAKVFKFKKFEKNFFKRNWFLLFEVPFFIFISHPKVRGGLFYVYFLSFIFYHFKTRRQAIREIEEVVG